MSYKYNKKYTIISNRIQIYSVLNHMVGISGRSLWLIWCQKSEVRGRRTEARGQRLKNSDWERITFDLLGKSEGSLSLNLTFCRFLKFGLLDICALHCLYNHNYKQNPGMNWFRCFRHRNRLVCL